eukprot:8621033-Pyramimonas_sp.AAC.1
MDACPGLWTLLGPLAPFSLGPLAEICPPPARPPPGLRKQNEGPAPKSTRARPRPTRAGARPRARAASGGQASRSGQRGAGTRGKGA